jgi:hypothetical protein
MSLPKSTLAKYMAFLISIPPDSNLAKLLKFCLVTNFDGENISKNELEISQELLANPTDLPYWIQEIMGSDRVYSTNELAAFSEMNLNNTEEFIKILWQELENSHLENRF